MRRARFTRRSVAVTGVALLGLAFSACQLVTGLDGYSVPPNTSDQSGGGTGAGGGGDTTLNPDGGGGAGAATTGGPVLWSRSLGDSDRQDALDVVVNATGPVLAGDFGGAIVLEESEISLTTLDSDNSEDFYVIQLAATTGDGVWGRSFGANGMQRARRLAQGDDGALYVGGAFRAPFSIGDTDLIPRGGLFADQGFVARLAPEDGAPQWAIEITGDGGVRVFDVAVHADSVIVAGSYTALDATAGSLSFPAPDGEDGFILTLDATTGEADAIRVFSGPGPDEARAVQADPATAGGVFVAVQYDQTVDVGGDLLTSLGGSDIAVARLDATGEAVWSSTFGNPTGFGSGPDTVVAMVRDDRGGLYLQGTIVGSAADFGGGPLSAKPSSDIYVVGLNQEDGTHRFSFSLFGDGGSAEAPGKIAARGGTVAFTGTCAGNYLPPGGDAVACAGTDPFLFTLEGADGAPGRTEQIFGSASGAGRGVALGPDGTLYAVGRFTESLEVGDDQLDALGQEDIYVAAYPPE
ncbi:MAG: hypothetical protein AAGA56_14970 [Myxococcota bacterium]